MRNLIAGVHRFQERVFAPHHAFFEKLERGQAPMALLITCSDSRVSPSLITQTKPGELFVLRNVGNMIPPYSKMPSSAAATIEYALEVLGVRDIIVCGHSACGAMHGVLNPDAVAAMPAVSAWLAFAQKVRDIVRDHYGDETPEHQLDIAVEVNVLEQVANLYTHPSVRRRLDAGELSLHGWVYDIAEGRVLTWNRDSGQFEPVTAAAGDAVGAAAA